MPPLREADSSVTFGHIGRLPPEEVILGHTEAMQVIRGKLEKVASANVPVIIQGESGTGKELVAKLVHRRSPWAGGPFVKVACPAIPAGLLESELFGYEKGAFTGASGSKPGWVELAQGGTLFLDEIAELDLALQSKLLQLLQDGRFSRIGAQEDRQVAMRVICTTKRALQREIEAGNFRQDLFYRLNVVTMELPPLRERLDDIPELVEYFLGLYNEEYNCRVAPLSDGSLRLFRQHDWPGNIRELENLIKRYAILGSEEAIRTELLGVHQDSCGSEIRAGESISLKKLTRQAVRDLERKIILRTLEANNWNRRAAARALNISYRTLFYKIKAAGVLHKRGAAGQRPPARPSGLPSEQ